MATPTASFEVRGLRAVDAALRDLPGEVSGAIFATALGAAGDVVRRGVIEGIRARTGRTGRDIEVRVRTSARDLSGRAAIGGTRGKSGRDHVLRFLEFGTKPHVIPKSGAERKRLSFAGIVRARVKHPGIAPQRPLRRALASRGQEAIQVFAKTAWEGIRTACERLRRRSRG